MEICICCGRPRKKFTDLCEECRTQGLTPENQAFFMKELDAIAYGESRSDWPEFRIRHLRDHKYVVYREDKEGGIL